MLSSAQGSLQVITLADGGPRPLTRADLLYVRSEPVPLFVQFLQAFFTFLPWLHQTLSCGVLLLMKRLHLFVLRLFVTCEDYRLRSAPDITFNALSEFTAESWQALLHLSTSPVPQVGRVDPQLVERGLGAVGSYTISDDLWCELAPPDFEASVSDFHLGRESHSSNREALVRPMVKWLLREEIVTIMDESCPLRATCWPFVIPKSTEKVSLIFNLVEFNESLHKPLSFSLDGWEQISKKLADWPANRPLFCTHVDLKNAFWSFKLPRRHERAFRFRMRWEGVERVFCMSRMPFGWKHSPLFCQTALGRIVRPLIPEGYTLFHYLDDFLILGPDLARLRVVTARVVRALEEAGFIVSGKSTLEPVTDIFFLGKYINLGVRTIRSHPRAFLQMFNIWLRLATRSRPSSRLLSKALGFIHWHFRPRLGGGPLLAGSYCCDRWGGFERPTPLKVLHGLCTAIVRCMETWEPPAPARLAVFHALSATPDLWAVRHCVMFGDAALDTIRYRGGAFIPRLSGVRSQVIPPARHTQQSAELWVLVWLVRLAVRLGWSYVVLVTDSQVSACQLVSLRASTWLSRQQRLLRALVLRLLQSGLIVEVRLVPGVLQPADPPSRLDSNFQSNVQRACIRAFQLWRVLLKHPREVVPVGGLVL